MKGVKMYYYSKISPLTDVAVYLENNQIIVEVPKYREYQPFGKILSKLFLFSARKSCIKLARIIYKALKKIPVFKIKLSVKYAGKKVVFQRYEVDDIYHYLLNLKRAKLRLKVDSIMLSILEDLVLSIDREHLYQEK